MRSIRLALLACLVLACQAQTIYHVPTEPIPARLCRMAPTAGQVLAWSTVNGCWQPAAAADAGLSAWTGSGNVTALGTVVTGVWHGTAIGDVYISSAATWNAKQNAISGAPGTWPSTFTPPGPGASTLGGVTTGKCSAGTYADGYNADGSPHCTSVGTGGTWGTIIGTLTAQGDLNTALSAKETAANKDQNSGYVGRASDGSANVPGGLTTGSGPMLLTGPHVAAASVATPPAGSFTTFYNTTNSDHSSRMDSARTVVDLEASGSGGGAIPTPTPGTSIALSSTSGNAICTGTCTVTVPAPVAGTKFCIYDDDAVTSAITINNPGSGVRFGIPDRSGYGTASVGRLVSTSGTNSQICLVGRDTTHYTVTYATGTWTNTDPISYVGPGDLAPGAATWYGLRAYSLATTGHAVANICNASDANCADVSSLSSGAFDLAAATGAPLNCGGSGGTCTVKKLYDQTTGGLCGGSCDLVMGTVAVRPTLHLSCSGSLPCMSFDAASSQQMVSADVLASAIAQPYSISSVARRTGNFSAYNDITGSANNPQFGFNNSADNAFMYAGSTPSVSAPDNTIYSLQGLFNGASSSLYLNGTPNTVNPGTTSASSTMCIGGCNQHLTGDVFEVGWWASSLSSSFVGLSANQRAYWGF